MHNDRVRYFLWNVFHPFDELLETLQNKGELEYYDDKYSPLLDKVAMLCIKILNIFEDPIFSSVHGINKRNELNNSDEVFHRILSFGIKAKHGKITSKYYDEFHLDLPLSVFYNENTNKYFYKYTPLIDNIDFVKDFRYIIDKLIELYSLRITYHQKFEDMLFDMTEDNTFYLTTIDTYNFYQNLMTHSCKIRTLKFKNGEWIVDDLNKQIHFALKNID